MLLLFRSHLHCCVSQLCHLRWAKFIDNNGLSTCGRNQGLRQSRASCVEHRIMTNAACHARGEKLHLVKIPSPTQTNLTSVPNSSLDPLSAPGINWEQNRLQIFIGNSNFHSLIIHTQFSLSLSPPLCHLNPQITVQNLLTLQQLRCVTTASILQAGSKGYLSCTESLLSLQASRNLNSRLPKPPSSPRSSIMASVRMSTIR